MISKFIAFHENLSLQITSLSSLCYYALNFDEMHIPSYGAGANLWIEGTVNAVLFVTYIIF